MRLAESQKQSDCQAYSRASGLRDSWVLLDCNGLNLANLLFHVHETRILALEGDGHGAGWARTLLSQDNVSFAGTRVFLFTDSFTVQKDNDVGVLL
jgi:hypothetical protein